MKNSNLKIAILTRDKNLYSCKRLKQSAENLGHTVEIINPLLCDIKIKNTVRTLYFNKKKIGHFDIVIPRVSATIAMYSMAIFRQFEISGNYLLNSSLAISYARDKLHTFQILSNKGIDIPITGFSYCTKEIYSLIDKIGIPVIIKLIQGTQGTGVMLAETRYAAESIIDAFRTLHVPILLQEYIKESNGEDIRCLVVGNKVVGSIKRQAKKGDFRSNLHRGGKAYLTNVSNLEKEIAVKSANILGLNLAGVDILRSSRGPLVMEVNSSPGFEGLESITKIDISTLIIKWIEKNIKVLNSF